MDYSAGGLSDFPRKKKTEEEKKAEEIKKRADGLLKKMEERTGKSLEQFDKSYLIHLIREIIVLLCHDRAVLRTATQYLTVTSSLIKKRSFVDSKRTEKRDDRIDKQAFQGAVRLNIETYDRVEDAVQDLIIKPAFAKYKPKTLWRWAREVWSKPTKSGRPPKKRT